MRAALAAAAVAVVAAVIVLAQPTRSPWWTYADADATYVASGLNLLVGEPTRYLDHPGLPLQQWLEVSFGAGWLASGEDRRTYAERVLLDLDRARPHFRSTAIAIYVGGAGVVALALSALFGGALWGLAGGLLWLGAPGLVGMSIQYRPDVLLAAACVVAVWLIARAAERRTTTGYVLAAVAVGVAMTVKIHAAGLLVPLALAAAWRRPRGELSLRVPRAVWVAWAALAVALNANNVPFEPTAEQAGAGAAALAAVVGAFAVRRRLPGVAALVGGVAGGVLLPVSLGLRDGLQALVVMANGLGGGGVNTGVEPFSGTLDDAWTRVPRYAFLLFAVAALAAVVGLVRREPTPVLAFAGAATLAAMGLARFADTHYFAPGYVVALIAVLWLVRTLPRGTVVAALAFAVAVAGQTVADRHDPGRDREAFRARAAAELEPALARAGSRQVVLTPSYWPAPWTRYFEVVRPYTDLAPERPYRTLPASRAAVEYAQRRGLRIVAAVGGATQPGR